MLYFELKEYELKNRFGVVDEFTQGGVLGLTPPT